MMTVFLNYTIISIILELFIVNNKSSIEYINRMEKPYNKSGFQS